MSQGLTQTHLLAAETTAAVVLGAHDWTEAGLGRAPSFRRSARRIVQFLYDTRGFALDPDLILDLFDDPSSAADQLARIRDTLDYQIRERHTAGINVTDILLYYVGHGHPDSEGSLSLLVRRTRKGQEIEGGIRTPDLARNLRMGAPKQRRHVILDCCYSEQAVKAFIGMSSDLSQQSASIVIDDLTKNQPSRGTIVLCSSPANRISIGHPDSESTLFSGAFIDVLRNGVSGKGEFLTYSDLRETIYDKMLERFGANAPRPALHQANQEFGDLLRFPAFLNRQEQARLEAEEARRQEQAQLAAREAQRQEQARLEAEEARRQEQAQLAAREAQSQEQARLEAEEDRRKGIAQQRHDEVRFSDGLAPSHTTFSFGQIVIIIFATSLLCAFMFSIMTKTTSISIVAGGLSGSFIAIMLLTIFTETLSTLYNFSVMFVTSRLIKISNDPTTNAIFYLAILSVPFLVVVVLNNRSEVVVLGDASVQSCSFERLDDHTIGGRVTLKVPVDAASKNVLANTAINVLDGSGSYSENLISEKNVDRDVYGNMTVWFKKSPRSDNLSSLSAVNRSSIQNCVETFSR